MSKKKILIVEDDDELRTVLTLGLEAAGYEIMQAEDGEKGFRLAQAGRPDLIISDIVMPKMDGNELMKKLRASEFGKTIPFIILTARGKMKDYFEFMEIDDFIAKPFESEDLLMRIERVLYQPNREIRLSGKSALKGQGVRKVLILENAGNIYSVLQESLQECAHKYEVKVATSVAECFEDIVLFRPDVIAMRFYLEEMESAMFVHIVREMPHGRDIPIIVYSHHELRGEQKAVLEAGASSFIGEITNEKLIDEIARIQ